MKQSKAARDLIAQMEAITENQEYQNKKKPFWKSPPNAKHDSINSFVNVEMMEKSGQITMIKQEKTVDERKGTEGDEDVFEDPVEDKEQMRFIDIGETPPGVSSKMKPKTVSPMQ